VLELGVGSRIDGRREAMPGKRLLSFVALLVVPVSTEVKGTGVGIGVLDSCGSADDACSDLGIGVLDSCGLADDDTCSDVGVGVLDSCGPTDDTGSDVVNPLTSGMSRLMSGSDTELLEVGVTTARSGALSVDDALEVLVVEASVEASTEGAVVGATVGVFVEGSTEGSDDGTVVGTVVGTVGVTAEGSDDGTVEGTAAGTVDVGVEESGVASVGEVVELVEGVN
jgi:hypothetical protein